MQYASLLNSFASFAAAPAIISYSSASPIARVAVATSVLAFALITTGGLHWFTKPYVHQLLYNKQVRWLVSLNARCGQFDVKCAYQLGCLVD
jgi:hypothetical protein